MRILHVIESLGRGGAEQALVNLLPAMVARGHACEVAVLQGPYHLAAPLEEAGIPVHRLALSHRWNVPQGVSRLTAVVRRGRFDVVHAHLYFGCLYTGLVPLRAGAPRRVTSFHNLAYDTNPANTAWYRARKALERAVLRRRMNGVTGVSTAVAEHFRSVHELPRVEVIPNAFPVGSYALSSGHECARAREELGYGPGDFVVVSPGRLVVEKGQEFLIRAAARLLPSTPALRVLVLGRGPLAEPLARLTVELGVQDRVAIRPEVPYERLLTIVQAADLLVLPSVSEGFGLVAAEAMAVGTPVVATRVGGLVDLVEDGTSGLLVPSADPAALTEAIARFVREPGLASRIGAAGRVRIVSHFSAEVVAASLERFYAAESGCLPAPHPTPSRHGHGGGNPPKDETMPERVRR